MRLPSFLLFLLLAINAKGQNPNLVPNASFEQYINCPTLSGPLTNYCVGWRAFTSGTPDYFHSCGQGSYGVPMNSPGFQVPAQGNAYVGLFSVVNYFSTMSKEYIATSISSLTVGATYEVSMSVSLANYAGFGTDDLGVRFYDNGPFTINTTALLTTFPQVSYSSYGPIIDTQNWVRLTKTFVADSAYDNIIIGGFKDWSTIDTQLVIPGLIWASPNYCSYYLVDSVVIRRIDSISFSYHDTLLCTGDSIIAPFYVATGYFLPTNTFTLQLSNAAGSFASPTTIAMLTGNTSGTLKGVVPGSISGGSGYKIRIVSSSPAKAIVEPKIISIGLSQPAKPAATGNSPACGGDTLFLSATTSTTGITWHWTGPSSFASTLSNPTISNFGPTNAGNYVVTARNFGCEAKDTVSITYQPVAPLNATNTGPVCNGTGLTLGTTATTPGASYSWTGPNSFASNLQNPSFSSATVNQSGDYIVTATLNGCVTKDTTTVLVKPVPVVTAANNGPFCEGETLNLIGTSSISGSSFTWSGPAGYSSNQQSPVIASITSGQQGNYSVTVTKEGCSSQPVATTVVVYPIPDIFLGNDTTLCRAETLTVGTNINNVSYRWQDGSTTSFYTISQAGKYYVTVNVGHCTSSDTINVRYNNLSIKLGDDTTLCAGQLLQLAATDTFDAFNWSTSETDSSIVIDHQGSYWICVKKDECTASDTININYLNSHLELGSNALLCNGDVLNLDAQNTSTSSYLWNDGSTEGSFVVSAPGIYWVQVINQCDTLTDTVTVAYEQCDCTPFIPSAFTPNSDGLNDNVAPILNCDVQRYKFIIANRFGQIVFLSSTPDQKWNGTFNGVLAELGTYYYFLEITGPRNKVFRFKGDIVLIR